MIDIVISKESNDYYQDSKKILGSVRICFAVSGFEFQKFLDTVKKELYANEYYGIFKMNLTSPKQLFDRFRYLQPWGGSPGVECGYFADYAERDVYEKVVFETNAESETDIHVDIDNKTIKFVFKTAAVFDDFTKEFRNVSASRPIMVGKSNIPMMFSSDGFKG